MQIQTYRFAVLILALCGVMTGAQAQENLMTRAHSHNDYTRPHPLTDALDNQFYSVEADIYLVDGKIVVTHNLPDWEATLKENYLDPLQKRVDEKGSVYGDGLPFLLWVDVKRGGADLKQALTELLDGYSMLSVYSDAEVKPGPVTLILTGDDAFKRDYVTLPVRKACRDSNDYSPDDPKADHGWTWYAVSWGKLFNWKGSGPFPEAERAKLKDVVADMHAKGRKIRFYSTPETPVYWQAALDAGVDLINTDLLKDVHDFLTSKETSGADGYKAYQK
ncbi:MAG: hypothetical protein GC154_18005 [bacterium]|nr:hypothetical protein [bacterium]